MARPKGETYPQKCSGCSNVYLLDISAWHRKKCCKKYDTYCVDALKKCKGKNNDFKEANNGV